MNRWKASVLLCVLLFPVMTSYSQQLPPNAPSRQQVLNLFEAIQLRRTMEASQEVAMQSAVNTVQQMMRQRGVPVDAAMQQQMDAMMKGIMDDVRAVLSVDEMLEAVIPIYQRHFTVDEVNAIIAFQNSPVGKKLVNLQPVMMQESVQAMAPLQQRAMPELMKRLNERMEKVLQPTVTPVPPVPGQRN
jgi:uncharacterized protein